MRHFRRSHSFASHSEHRVSPWIIIAICAASALVLTVIVGNLLKIWIDDDTYRRLTSGEGSPDEEQPPIYVADKKDVHAYAYSFGEDTERLWESPEVSISINTPDGRVNYTSVITSYFGFPTLGSVALDKGFSDLSAAATHISGVFYPQAPRETDKNLRFALAAKEQALLNEFLQMGGIELLLCDLPLEDLTACAEYIGSIKQIAKEIPVGVAIPYSLLQEDGAWQMLTHLLKVCDFFAIDLGNAITTLSPRELITDCGYFLKEYDMRLLTYSDQAELIEAAAELEDMQTVKRFALPQAPTEGEEENQ